MNAIQTVAPAARCAAEIAARHAEWDNREFSPFEPVYMFANELGYSDIRPFEIVRRVSDKTIEIREMHAEQDPTWKPEVVIGGFMGHCTNNNEQRWNITSNPEGHIIRIRKQKNGEWKSATGARFGLAAEPVRFYDYNF